MKEAKSVTRTKTTAPPEKLAGSGIAAGDDPLQSTLTAAPPRRMVRHAKARWALSNRPIGLLINYHEVTR